jgi:hypothetical protein
LAKSSVKKWAGTLPAPERSKTARSYFFMGTGAGERACFGVPAAFGVGDGLWAGSAGVGESIGEAAGLGEDAGLGGVSLPPAPQAAERAVAIENSAVKSTLVFIVFSYELVNAD